MPSSEVKAEAARLLASCRSPLAKSSELLKAGLRVSPVALALLLIVAVEMSRTSPAPAPLPVSMAWPGYGDELNGPLPASLAPPIAVAAEGAEPGSAESWFQPAAGAYLPGARVTAVEPSTISVDSGGTAARPRLAERFETIAEPESRFVAALRHAAARGYRERFAGPEGRLSQSLAALAQRAEALADEQRAVTGETARRPTVAEQIRRNSEAMPTTVHLSALFVKGAGAVTATQQAAAPRVSARGS